MNVFVIDNENFNYDFLVGLDCIKNSRLIQTEELKIIQYKSSVEASEKNSDQKIEENKNVNIPELPGDINEEINKKSKNGKSIIIPKYISYTQNKYEINFNENLNTNEFEMIINHLLGVQKSSEL